MKGDNTILLPPGGKTKTDVHATPQWLFDRLNGEFDFSLDPCSDGTNSKCARFFTEADDGLLQDWGSGGVFVNPPYTQCEAWMRKSYLAARGDGATVVCLIPVRTDTAWWHEYAMKADEVRFIRGRLCFGNAKANAPFPSAVVVFRGRGDAQPTVSTMLREARR